MKNKIFTLLAALAFSVQIIAQGQGTTSPYTDATGDIDAGIATGGGTLDIVQMEVGNSATELIFTLTVNGDISLTDWGNFMIGIATEETAGDFAGNGWNRPIYLNSPSAGMNYWIGSWVNAGGGVQLWNYDGAVWQGPENIAGYELTAGAQSTIKYTIALSDLGLSAAETFYFDAYTSGGGGGDGAVDALANSSASISDWAQEYLSSRTEESGLGLNAYTIDDNPVPVELTTFAATVKGNAVELKWNTATEINNYGFDVLASADGTEFGKIAFVAGAGNSNTPKDYSFSVSGNSYKYFRLKQIDLDGKTTLSEIVEATAEITSFELSQNYPNPFNPSTTIRFALPSSSNVNLKVFNALGQEVAELVNSELNAGMHSVSFNASNLSSGVYYYRLTAGEFSQINKMMLVK